MKIAVTYENGNVFQHFGHTQQFKVYCIENGKILSSEVLETGESGHGALASLLSSWGVSKLICGGIGGGAKNALSQAGIELYCGVTGDADFQVQAYLDGYLQDDPNTECSHHGHSHEACGKHAGGRHDHN